MPPTKTHRSAAEVACYLHLPILDAARELGVCPALLKRLCRRHGLMRWPHRKVASITSQLRSLREASNAEPQGRLATDIMELRIMRETILANVGYTSLDALIYDYEPLPELETSSSDSDSVMMDVAPVATAVPLTQQILPAIPHAASAATLPGISQLTPVLTLTNSTPCSFTLRMSEKSAFLEQQRKRLEPAEEPVIIQQLLGRFQQFANVGSSPQFDMVTASSPHDMLYILHKRSLTAPGGLLAVRF
eukprot:TRINITY_DN9204_c0_g1_i1.p1 TRINITY_DN9204_c0_g1~~TRINITY_DN9204_c0_g1_i1.p1  ORF type:complete len:248 (-),score=32.89 TRINITY_DN9204_c0_g1_i1:285-1028(-)